jgi:hypothetical protein
MSIAHGSGYDAPKPSRDTGGGVIIRDWRLEEQADTLEVSAEIDGFRLRYRVPSTCRVSRSGDPFVAAAMFPAMLQGKALEVDPDLPVSAKFLENYSLLQEIFHTWNPLLKQIPVSASIAPSQPVNEGVCSFFSGGLDATYTFLKHQEEISHVIFIHGFDFFDEPENYARALERNARFVGSHGASLIPVDTNSSVLGHSYRLSGGLTQGSALGAIRLLLGFERTYVPAGVTYNDLVPLSTHPLTDPLWSNECMEVIHDGCEARRIDKVRRVAECDAALANLHVCTEDMNVNCGRCEKCVRTMIPLKLLGADHGPFPPLPSPTTIRKGGARPDETEIFFFKENYDLAVEIGGAQNRELRDALAARVRKAEVRRALGDLDRALLGGRLRRLLGRNQATSGIDVTPAGKQDEVGWSGRLMQR